MSPGSDQAVTGPALTVMIVDDHRVVADLMSLALAMQPGMDCVGTAANAAGGVAMAAELQPDVAIVDVQTARHDGFVTAARIRKVSPRTAVVLMSTQTDPRWHVTAALVGAAAFVTKTGSLGELIDVLRRVSTGSTPAAGSVPLPLTHRESEVLAGLSQGSTTTSIAHSLGITVQTCRGYIKSLIRKPGAHSRLEAVLKAQERGLL